MFIALHLEDLLDAGQAEPFGTLSAAEEVERGGRPAVVALIVTSVDVGVALESQLFPLGGTPKAF
jgi:hypothetical protein